MAIKKHIHTFDNGLKVFSDHLLNIQIDRYKEVNLHEPEEEKVFLKLLDEIPFNGVFVNIGSAIGYYMLLSKKSRPDLNVYGYEPLKRHRSFFYKNIYLNGFKKDDFILFDYGLSVKDGKASFFKKDYSSNIRLDKKKRFTDFLKIITGKTSFVNIKTISMATLLSQVRGKIHLLQLDIQGHEKEVLEAARNELSQNSIERILIGTHSATIHKRCLDILKECCYRITYDNYDTYLQPDGIIAGEKDI